MATGLETKLNRILQEKTEKIIPENFRAGIQLFDIIGSAPTIFNTKEEMEYTLNLPDRTFAIVYNTSFEGLFRFINGAWIEYGVPSDGVLAMNALNEVMRTNEEYEGLGGTEEEVETVLDTIMNGTIPEDDIPLDGDIVEEG